MEVLDPIPSFRLHGIRDRSSFPSPSSSSSPSPSSSSCTENERWTWIPLASELLEVFVSAPPLIALSSLESSQGLCVPAAAGTGYWFSASPPAPNIAPG